MVGEQSCYPGSGGKNGRDQCYQCVAHNVATMAQIKINSQPAAEENCGCGIDNSADRTERHGPRQHPFVVEQHCGQKSATAASGAYQGLIPSMKAKARPLAGYHTLNPLLACKMMSERVSSR